MQYENNQLLESLYLCSGSRSVELSLENVTLLGQEHQKMAFDLSTEDLLSWEWFKKELFDETL